MVSRDSPPLTSPISMLAPFGPDRISKLELGSWCMLRHICSQSLKVMQWQGFTSSFSRQSSRMRWWMLYNYSSSCFSSRAISSSLARISTTSRSIPGSSLPPIQWMVFLWVFSTYPIPSSTLVMSQMRLFCTANCYTASLRSTVLSGLRWINSMNFRVSTDRLLSCRPRPAFTPTVRTGVTPSSSESDSWRGSGGGACLRWVGWARLGILYYAGRYTSTPFSPWLTISRGRGMTGGVGLV